MYAEVILNCVCRIFITIKVQIFAKLKDYKKQNHTYIWGKIRGCNAHLCTYVSSLDIRFDIFLGKLKIFVFFFFKYVKS